MNLFDAIVIVFLVGILLHAVGATIYGYVSSFVRGGFLRALAIVLLILVVVAVVLSANVSAQFDSTWAIVSALVLALMLSIFFGCIGVYRTHKILVRKARHLWWAQVVPYVILIALFYPAIFPPADFYIEEFERHSGYTLPAEAQVIDRSASYPTYHGEYSSEALIRMSQSSLDELLKMMQPRHTNCYLSEPQVHASVIYTPGKCWRKEIEIDERIFVTFFLEEPAIHFYFYRN